MFNDTSSSISCLATPEKRKGAKRTFDFLLNIAFQSDMRWETESDPNEFLQFSLTRADLHLELTNGAVVPKGERRLGGEFETSVLVDSSLAESVTRSEREQATVKGKLGVNPWVKSDIGMISQRTGSQTSTSGVKSLRPQITPNFDNRSHPRWIFKPMNTYLEGDVQDAALCTVRGDSPSGLEYECRVLVRAIDVHISRTPRTWRFKLKYPALLKRGVQGVVAKLHTKTTNKGTV